MNRRILEILQEDARASAAEIAREVDRAESTVRERMMAMERIGLIRGYCAIIDPTVMGYEAHAVVRASCQLANLDKIVQDLLAVPQVVRAVLTTGKYPLVIEIVAENIRQLNWILESDLAKMDFVDLDPVVVLRDLIDFRRVPLARSTLSDVVRTQQAPAGVEIDDSPDAAVR